MEIANAADAARMRQTQCTKWPQCIDNRIDPWLLRKQVNWQLAIARGAPSPVDADSASNETEVF